MSYSDQGGKGGRPNVTVSEEDFEPGTVKFRHRDGYGFISREGKPDAYFHIDRIDPAIRDDVVGGVDVLIAVGSGKRGAVVLALKLP